MVANKSPKIAVVFYTTYLHIYKLAKAIKEGAEKSGQCEVNLYQVPETLSQEALDKMHAPPKPEIPIITPEILAEADGILFGYPTRYGTLPAQLKDFIDSCGKLWASGALQGKMAGAFCSSAGQHSGQETSIFTLLTTLTHFGMIFVPLGYASTFLNEDAEMIGGTPWGASVIAGKDGTRQPSTKELEIAHIQGENFAKTLCRYHNVTEPQETSVLSAEKELAQTTELPNEPAYVSPEANSSAAPTPLASENAQKAAESNELQTEPPVSSEEVAATTQVPPPAVNPENKVDASQPQTGDTSTSNAAEPDAMGSKDSTLGAKSTSGLKKFFKRLSVRSKHSGAN